MVYRFLCWFVMGLADTATAALWWWRYDQPDFYFRDADAIVLTLLLDVVLWVILGALAEIVCSLVRRLRGRVPGKTTLAPFFVLASVPVLATQHYFEFNARTLSYLCLSKFLLIVVYVLVESMAFTIQPSDGSGRGDAGDDE